MHQMASQVRYSYNQFSELADCAMCEDDLKEFYLFERDQLFTDIY